MDGDPLAGLDGIDWARHRHAYGSASDVPDLLRALRSADPDERDAALGELYTNIHHQGSRYDAAVPAVPFLLALAADPATPGREDLVYLLAALAVGLDESHLPGGVAIEEWRAEVGRLLDSGESERRAFEARHPWVDFEAARAMTVAELAAYDAVRAGLPVLRRLMRDPDAAIRTAAAYALGWFPEDAEESIPALQALLDAETVPAVTANALVSAGLLGGEVLLPRMREHLTGGDPLPRCAAAIALARSGVTDMPVIAELAAVCGSPPEPSGLTLAFLEGDLRAYAAASLAALDGAVPAEAVDAVLEGLSRTSETAAFPLASAALRLAFGAPNKALPPFGELTDVQKRAVRVLGDLSPETWQWVNLWEIVRAWGLPGDRDACRRYAGLG
ncbi:HEAT repeat domain-containing protein [Actinomadura fibrosa]|uniref:HEAT repeat domain-containing protein n=1 Tax=Actinomadura fibrosa TaxID=111802 RepID=A0ABW2XV32_9ACTN|nr:HEAT repeat domain-containing protein [Actinomadura fibrosa]